MLGCAIGGGCDKVDQWRMEDRVAGKRRGREDDSPWAVGGGCGIGDVCGCWRRIEAVS